DHSVVKTELPLATADVPPSAGYLLRTRSRATSCLTQTRSVCPVVAANACVDGWLRPRRGRAYHEAARKPPECCTHLTSLTGPTFRASASPSFGGYPLVFRQFAQRHRMNAAVFARRAGLLSQDRFRAIVIRRL